MKQIFPLTLGALLLGGSLTAAAMPAKPGLREYRQPDGTTITIEVCGNRNSHLIKNSEGLLLLSNEADSYEYATLGSDGLPCCSGVTAHNHGDRTAAELSFIGTLDQSAIAKGFATIHSNRLTSASLGRRAAPKRGPGLCKTSFPSKGEQKALVILVEYSDRSFDIGTDNAYDYFNNMLNQKGFSQYGATGSVRDWFEENSNGQFLPQFDVFGPVKLANKRSYYGRNSRNGDDEPYAYQMVTEACEALDSQIDFREYDRDGDGFVDNIYVFYAGYGEADSSMASTVWPHSADISFYDTNTYMFDGVRVEHYACSNETPYDYSHPDGIGTFVHEFSHVLGLPDLYTTVYNNAFTPGAWSALDYGPYNNEGRTPPNYSAYERYALDWMTPSELNNTGIFTLENISDSNEAYIVHSSNPDEFFLLENRQQKGNDAFIPGHGMLVWHIDYDEDIFEYNEVNNTLNHQRVDIVEADNRKTEATRSGDSFPGTGNITSFTPTTTPAFVDWSKQSTGVSLTEISESNGLISFRADVEGSSVSTLALTNGFHLNGRQLTANQPVEIFDFTGRLIATGTHVSLPQNGIYLVRLSNGRSSKIVIR